SARVTVNMITDQEGARKMKTGESRIMTGDAAMITLRSGKQVASPVKQKVGIVRKEIIAR
ncbi:hypothetical protein PJP07_31245, partial [Mycobacterium kansasii]